MLDNNYIDNLLNIEDKNLLNEFFSLPNEKKKLFLVNEKLKAKIINSFYLFSSLIKLLNKELLDILLDQKGIDILLNSDKSFPKIYILLNFDTNIADAVLTNEKVLAKIYQRCDIFRLSFRTKSVFFVQKFFDYLINNNLNLSKIVYCCNNLNEILKKQENLDKIIQNKLIDVKNLKLYDNNSIAVLLENPYFENLILDDKYDISELIFKGGTFNEKILKDKRFIEKIVNEKDIGKYRFMMDSLKQNNNLLYLEDIERKRKVYYDNIINSYDKNLGMFKKYTDILNLLMEGNKTVDQQILFDLNLNANLSNDLCYDIYTTLFNRELDNSDKLIKLKVAFMKATALEFKEILIDRYYEENIYNFKLDLENLIRFNTEQKVINNQNMEHYLKLLKLLNDDSKVDIDIYNSFDKNKNYIEEYYDDFYMSRLKSYSLINDSLINVENIKSQKNDVLSSKYGVDIYEFKGEKFYMMIHNTSIDKKSEVNIDDVFDNYDDRDGTSMSFISDLKMHFYRENKNTIILGFNNLDINSFVHVYHSDSYSNYQKKNGISANKQNKLYTPMSLIDNTESYNEIVYQIRTDNTRYLSSKKLTPSYVVVFDEILPIDLEIAKKFNIPIIRIDKQKYNTDIRKKPDKQEDMYAFSYSELQKKRR